jgi:hypothetical protein
MPNEICENRPAEDTTDMADNHYLVQGHLEGEAYDYTEYVLAPAAYEAETKFKEWLGKQHAGERVFVTLVVQIPGPPIAIFSEEELRENIKPIE